MQPLQYNTIYEFVLQKTLVFRTQPQQWGTWRSHSTAICRHEAVTHRPHNRITQNGDINCSSKPDLDAQAEERKGIEKENH